MGGNEKEYYLRTDLGEFKVVATEEKMKSMVWQGYQSSREPISVQTLTGFPCFVRPQDIKIAGELKDYMNIVQKHLPHGEVLAQGQEFDALRFGFSQKSGLVTITMLNAKSNDGVSLEFGLTDFVHKLLDELPNKVTDAIMDEKEKRAYS